MGQNITKQLHFTVQDVKGMDEVFTMTEVNAVPLHAKKGKHPVPGPCHGPSCAGSLGIRNPDS